MKPLRYTLIALAAACGFANAATAYTTPVGYVSLGNTAGLAVPADTDFYMSIPLERAAVYAGLVASVSESTITLQGSPALGDLVTVPHIAKITSGGGEGLIGLITANDAGSVTISVPTGDSLSGVASGTTISIQLAWTLKTLFAGGSVPETTQVLAYSGTAPGVNIAADLAFEFVAGTWTDLATFLPADDVALFPGEGFIVRTPATEGIQSLVITGTVPVSDHRTVISNLDATAGQDNIVGYFSPVSEILGVSGLGINTGDQILLVDDFEATGVNVTAGINKSSVTTLEFDATAGTWTDLATFADVTATFALKAGTSFIYRVVGGTPLGDTVWKDEQTYVPTL